jgi:hypothetical protein
LLRQKEKDSKKKKATFLQPLRGKKEAILRIISVRLSSVWRWLFAYDCNYLANSAVSGFCLLLQL